jgi:DNA repair protein RadA/Sms
MAKPRTTFVCQQCGFTSPGFLGRCPNCGSWNSMVETIEDRRPGVTGPRTRAAARAQPLREVGSAEHDRITVPIQELDRVLGGGLVAGSLVLIGGDPGIGKSTLVLQAAAALAGRVGPVLYVSAEESAQQIKLRADRLGVDADQLWVLSETNLAEILEAAAA